MKLSDWPPELRARIQAQSKARRDAASMFAAAIAAEDVDGVAEGLDQLAATGAHLAAFRLIAKVGPISDEWRRSLLSLWTGSGDGLRSAVNDDLVLLPALRKILPTYTGPAVTLFRGEGAWNRSRRTYGMSWTSNLEVAEAHARSGMYRFSQGGSLVLSTLAPPEAIVCDVSLHIEDRYEESEILVDRRRLGQVTVLRRYSQQTAAEQSARFEESVVGEGHGVLLREKSTNG